MKIFLIVSFRQEDWRVRSWFESYLRAWRECQVVLANDGIDPPRDQIRARMRQCDLVCFVLTNRGGVAPAWILQEIEIARELGLPLFGFIERGIQPDALGGLASHVAYQQFDREALNDDFPLWISYTHNARWAALHQQGIDRQTLLLTIARLQHEIELLEHLLKARVFE